MIGFIFAAGIGSRLKPWTDHHPKALVPVGGKPMLQHVIENMIRIGITEIIVNVHHFHRQIISFLTSRNNFGINIYISDESEQLLDTGGAIIRAASELLAHDTIIIHNADIYTDIDLRLILEYHHHMGGDATLLTSARKSSRQLVFDQDSRLKGWVNNTLDLHLPENLAIDKVNDQLLSFNGIHVITPAVINSIQEIAHHSPFPIIPQYVTLSNRLSINAFTPDFDYIWVDIGRPDSLKLARTIASSRRKS